MPEVLGVATVCIEGRRRRHLGTAAISRIILANASQALMEPQRLATALALGLRCVAERNNYEVGFHFRLIISSLLKGRLAEGHKEVCNMECIAKSTTVLFVGKARPCAETC